MFRRNNAVRLLALTQSALEELDRFNIATARSHIFDLNWQLREVIKLLDNEDPDDTNP